ncbi:MAG: response regulator [Deltaproteobacteria bacterium]|nr:response regulator [Deltaproteobacteria bacterium]MBN2673892.1 response regulator [Deltaproteobacteria bacterium]
MPVPLRVLLVEDREDDAIIVLRQLKKKGYDVVSARVDTYAEMHANLLDSTWDVVLADYALPSFSAPEALALLKSEGFDIPFIIVSGTIDEHTAVAAMEAGAHDYVTKDNLIRLVPAIERELREAKERRERKRSEEALRRSEERFRTVVDASIDTLISVDLDGSISLFNQAATRMLKYEWTEVIGQSIDMLISPDYRADVNFFVASQSSVSVPSHRIIGNTIEVDALTKGGEKLPVELSLSYGTRGREDFLLVIMRDISEKRRSQEVLEETEAQLRLSQKMEAIGRLAGGVAHDFNNLLGAILGYSDVMLLDVKEGDPLREDILEISRAAKRAAELTRQLLVFSRKQVMQPQVFSMNVVVEGAKRMLGRLIGEDIHLETHLEDELKTTKADPVQMEQVIMNLVVNARDAMPDGGKLSIRTYNVKIPIENAIRDFQNSISGDAVVLEVEDTGMGMSDEVLSHIFEPFFTTKEQGKGTGLGLSTVFGIVKQSDGVITVNSEISQGTTFKVYMPAVDEITEQLQIIAERREPHRGTETILVVEDEQMLRSLICRLLRKSGYKVFEAADGQEAITFIDGFDGHMDLLITDVVMPKMNGRNLAEIAVKRNKGLKVLFMSGYADDTLMQHGVFNVGQSYIQKPFSADALCLRVRQILTE